MKKRRFIVFADVILIIAVCILAFVGMSFLYSDEPSLAVITVDGKEYMRVDLQNEQEINIENVKILIKDNYISIVNSDCPDKVCIETGKIKNAGSVVACVPNKIVITVVKNDNYVDGVTG